jgi:hypothetical protein
MASPTRERIKALRSDADHYRKAARRESGRDEIAADYYRRRAQAREDEADKIEGGRWR